VSLLLDTMAFLWWLSGDPQLGPGARSTIGSPATAVHVSSASAWEISVKRSIGKLVASFDVEQEVANEHFVELPISIAHGVAAGALPLHHRDPFDRMLIAQAHAENLTLVTSDARFAAYGVALLDATA
jgi:PIN domain nuclease of toxin-antitoxin system